MFVCGGESSSVDYRYTTLVLRRALRMHRHDFITVLSVLTGAPLVREFVHLI